MQEILIAVGIFTAVVTGLGVIILISRGFLVPSGDLTIQEIAARHQVHPNQVSTWKRQAVEGMADVFAKGGKVEGPTETEVKELHAKIGKLTIENDFLVQGLKK